MEIKKINAITTYSVRHKVLRKGMPIESCKFNDDEKPDTVHFGLYCKENLIGIISVFKAKHHLFDETNQFQIRGMAILEKHQGKGYGSQLVKKAEDYCANLNGDLIWFNAREISTGFYKKLGYLILEESFLIPNVGVHFVMHKKIRNN